MKYLKNNLINHVKLLSTLGEKSLKNISALNTAKDYIIGNFGKKNIILQEYKCNNESVYNIELTKQGDLNPDNIILIGAHYDTIYSGANDNCSGIACLIELVRLFNNIKTDKTIKFVAFTNEEPPYFNTNLMGSQMYAKMCKHNNINIELALIMDLVGYYSDEFNSQLNPYIKNISTIGNFIAMIGQIDVEDDIKKCIKLFKNCGSFPVEMMVFDSNEFPSYCSDHSSFNKYNYKSFLLTDTALYRYKYYHTDYDTYDKLNYDKMTDMVINLFEMLKCLVGVPTCLNLLNN